MLATKLGRAWAVYLGAGLLTFILLLISETFGALSSEDRDWLVVAAGAVLYVLSYAVVLPFWNARAARRHAPGSTNSEIHATRSPNYSGRWLSTGALLVLAVVFSWAQLRMSMRFSETELRSSTLHLLPALNALLCAAAILVVPPGSSGGTWVGKFVLVLKWTGLLAFAVAGVLIFPAIALLEWEIYDFQTYIGSVRPLWLALPAASVIVRTLRHANKRPR